MKKCQVFTPGNKFSYIIGNPPYITYSEIKKTEIKKLKNLLILVQRENLIIVMHLLKKV